VDNDDSVPRLSTYAGSTVITVLLYTTQQHGDDSVQTDN